MLCPASQPYLKALVQGLRIISSTSRSCKARIRYLAFVQVRSILEDHGLCNACIYQVLPQSPMRHDVADYLRIGLGADRHSDRILTALAASQTNGLT